MVLGSCKYVEIGGRPRYQRANPFAVHAHVVGWVQRVTGTVFIEFADLYIPQQFEIATKLANPTRLIANHRLTQLENRVEEPGWVFVYPTLNSSTAREESGTTSIDWK